MQTTAYYDDFLLYYKKAEILQKKNLGLVLSSVIANDPLMDHITIYDTISRKFAGFSNALQQLWCGSENPKQHQANPHFDGLREKWSTETWLFVFIVHRMTGSGASFQYDHGFRNSILATFGTRCLNIDEMIEIIFTWQGPMFTSIGNQPPSIKKPNNSTYATGGAYFFCEYGKQLAYDLAQWLRSGGIKTIRETVEFCLDWVSENGFKRFKFVLTAVAMDIAEYMSDLVDPRSHANYGKNALESLDLMFTPDEGKHRNDAFYDEVMDFLCDTVVGMPYDVEDVLCDFVRAQENYIPKGYSHLSIDQIKYNSFDLHPVKHQSYHDHIKNLQSRLF